jgi:hypothetical protein
MKINMMKSYGGVFIPADDTEHEKTTKFKNNEMYEIEIKLSRNPKFLRKVFAFFNFCFAHWSSHNIFMDDAAQKEYFRKDLTIKAGYYTSSYNFKGELSVTAESLSFASMSQERFEQVYSALINAALVHIFADCKDANIENQLVGFFS